MRLSAAVSALALAGCGFPHLTRPANDEEWTAIFQMTRAISEHARERSNAIDVRVAEELRKAQADERISIFEDKPSINDQCCRGTTRLGRIYLHTSLFEPQWNEETLRIIYHEGVHLAQGWWKLFCEPEAAEDEAHECQTRFLKDYGGPTGPEAAR